MALKSSITKAEHDALPEGLRVAYVAKGEGFVLDVEGLIPASEVAELKSKLNEFRDNNVKLLKQVSDLEPQIARFSGIDPDEVKKLKADAEKLKGKGVKDPSDIEAIIANALKPLTEKLEASEKAAAEARATAARAKFRELVGNEASKAKVRTSGLRHVLRDAEDVFELDATGEKLVAKAGKTHPTESYKDLTPDVWLGELAKSDAYLFETSSGADTNPGGAASSTARVAKTTLINPTAEQMGANLDAIIKGDVAVVRN